MKRVEDRRELLRHLTRAATIAIGLLALSHDENRAQPRVDSPALKPLDAAKVCPPVAPGLHESYRLPANKPPPGVSFASDWSANATGGWFGIQAMDRCRMQPDGTTTWHGKQAVRVEVQPSDDPLALHQNSERAEVLSIQDANGAELKETAESGTQYYATSYYFPATWRAQQLPWSAFQPIDCPRNQDQCNSWSVVWQFYGWGGLSAAQTVVNGPQHYRFNDNDFLVHGQLALGKWTDLVFMVDWRSGIYNVWRRDEGEKKFTLVLSGAKPLQAGWQVYIKQGLYRGGSVAGRTDVMWTGPTVRGASFAAVERQAFGTEDGVSP